MKALLVALLSSVTLYGKHFRQSVEALKAEMNQFYDNGVMERKKGQKKGSLPTSTILLTLNLNLYEKNVVQI